VIITRLLLKKYKHFFKIDLNKKYYLGNISKRIEKVAWLEVFNGIRYNDDLRFCVEIILIDI
ncbi:hypothetical protein, partial [Turicibacter sp. T129]|uniref:hypothetical protein n=1 Tax=Turicibacter sp. T129 TaxID=2951141 RepID=UPI0021D4B8B7